MKMIKRADRKMKASDLILGLKAAGSTVTNLGKFSRWVDVSDGRVQWSFTLYEIADNGKTAYFLKDSLGWLSCVITPEKQEVLGWLKAHGYKPEKQWYIEDYGMSPETWAAWNGEGEEE